VFDWHYITTTDNKVKSYVAGYLLCTFLKMSRDKIKIEVPEWAKRVVWYQIFPERFRNGDPKNDPTIDDIRGAWPHDTASPWQIHPWTSDWYELQPYEKRNGKDIWQNIHRRRYGGDLQGVLDKLDYLKDLGIGAIYLNPVFESPSSHKYDGATYHHIDPTFGPDPADDRAMMTRETPHDPSTWQWTSADRLMLKLIGEVHRRGMRIIFDGVFNHMGINSWAFRDVVKNQQRSRYKDWFKILSWDDPQNGETFNYSGWWAVPELPELNQDENGIVAGPREYIFAATRRWMDPNGDGNPDDGIDGWRLDVADYVRHNFWKAWRKLVRSINPEAYVVGEIVKNEDYLRPYLSGDEFDAVMNYNFMFICSRFFIERNKPISVSEFDRQLRVLREAFQPDVSYVMQNLFDSHDSNRLASHIVNGQAVWEEEWHDYHNTSKAENLNYNPRKPNAEEIKVQKLMALFQMTYLGAPMIYYGDEAGMWGANDPCCRKPMVWDDMNDADEVFLPDGSLRSQPDKVAFDHDLHAYYRKLIHLRNAHRSLQIGDFLTLLCDDAAQVYAFSRTYGNERIVVVLNNSKSERRTAVPLRSSGRYQDVLGNGGVYLAANEKLEIGSASKEGIILLRV
jgi:glycosidase